MLGWPSLFPTGWRWFIFVTPATPFSFLPDLGVWRSIGVTCLLPAGSISFIIGAYGEGDSEFPSYLLLASSCELINTLTLGKC